MDKNTERFLDHLKGEKNYSANTLTGYTHDLQQFYRFLDKRPVEQVSRDQVRGYLAQMNGEGLSKRTVGRRMAALRSRHR